MPDLVSPDTIQIMGCLTTTKKCKFLVTSRALSADNTEVDIFACSCEDETACGCMKCMVPIDSQ